MSRGLVPPAPVNPTAPGRQRASVSLKFGRRRGFSASVEVTPAGLLAIGGLVSSILLSTAVLVRSAAAAKAAADAPPRLPAPGSRNL
ncbi:hypothetical protein LK533_09065 [Sphingomonas sp. PL-96]|uniref:hypothetical protein n=1 Tax=Sphingomonas sp. PL-96 TaxID=2887201 RepID=UPI001E4A12E4|nr:hypothetical protein [Sphingomonas sp. PL-96]MCC2976821.1 hypothetical protein [Sphingomonas sp. PL-96]